MTALRCEKEPVRPDHMDYDYMTALRCEKKNEHTRSYGCLMSMMCDVLVMM